MINKWSNKKANEWFSQLPWLRGYNYLPRTAVNWTDIWQQATFNTEIIDQELGWANQYGYNTLRTNLQYLVWKHDRDGLFERLNQFLDIAKKHGQYVMLCPFDDCAFSGDEPYLGPQKAPVHDMHNSQAAGSPGRKTLRKTEEWPYFEAYIRDLMKTFGLDDRILIWDLYNEPGNPTVFNKIFSPLTSFHWGFEKNSLKLLKGVFQWAREENPGQPLTAGAWNVGNTAVDSKLPLIDIIYDLFKDKNKPFYREEYDQFSLENSDIISFHAYVDYTTMARIVDHLHTTYKRPMMCTEWLGRQLKSTYEQIPLFKEHNISCYQWGLVNGRTQTHLPWIDLLKIRGITRDVWFHDVLKEDGTPYDQKEMDLLKELIK